MNAPRLVKSMSLIAGMSAILLFAGCVMSEKSPVGFRLPEGSIWKGKTAFVELGCINCHSVVDEDLMPEMTEPRQIHVALGGETTRVKTYGQLVTSIINPSHVVSPQYRDKYMDAEGNSVMTDFSKEMTVEQMIDLAEFLQARYEVVIPDYAYNEYGIGP